MTAIFWTHYQSQVFCIWWGFLSQMGNAALNINKEYDTCWATKGPEPAGEVMPPCPLPWQRLDLRSVTIHCFALFKKYAMVYAFGFLNTRNLTSLSTV